MKKFYFAILIVLAFFVQIQAQAETKIFSGTIADKKIQLTLTRSGDKLSGTYFYQNIGKDLRLSGTIDAEGNFQLDEFDAKNVKTGELKGTWKTGEDGGVWLEGLWINPKTKTDFALSAGEEMIYFTRAEKLVNRSFVEKNKQRMYEINADYPEISGVNPAIAAKFNQIIKTRVMKEVTDFKKEMLSMTAADLKFFKENGIGAYLDMGYMVDYASDKVVSVGFGNSTFEGGAHPSQFSFTINFDLAKGKKIELAELFKPNSNYLKVISEYCIKKLKEQQSEMTDDEWLATGAGAAAKNFSSWSIKRDGILISFDPYQVAAYAAGPQEVLIPYGELKNILRADSVVSSLR
ncbi:MAG TPA: DUF3298 and DUF4163 domain-containing protein [Pyrinomonadaceae bacterium]|jgi:hypothetical protein